MTVNRLFSICLTLGDSSDTTRIVKDVNLSNLDSDETLDSMVSKFYDFLTCIGVSPKDSYEACVDIGSQIVKDNLENEGSDDFESIDKKASEVKSKEDFERIESMINGEFFDKFLADFNLGDETFKKEVFRAFLKDLLKED
jgi:hypothetical protein